MDAEVDRVCLCVGLDGGNVEVDMGDLDMLELLGRPEGLWA